MQLFAPAKINLSLKILRRREDGFHEIETLMAPISLRDEITIEPNESGLVFSVDDPSLPVGEDNLVVRAARSFFGDVQEEPKVRITLRKKIPHGRPERIRCGRRPKRLWQEYLDAFDRGP